jgi:hypothetical protein
MVSFKSDPRNQFYKMNKTAYLKSLRGNRLSKPIKVSITKEYNEFIVTVEDIDISFSGKTVKAALKELEIEILEVYEIYKNENNLSPYLKNKLIILEDYLKI